MGRLNRTQIGDAAQYEILKLAILGGRGRLEAATPLTDDDRIDFLFHLKREFDRHLAVQAKCLTGLTGGRMAVYFSAPRRRLVSAKDFWYLFASLDLKTMAFRDPIFLVPSTLVHARMRPMPNGRRRFSASIGLAPDSRDRWVTHRVSPLKLGRRIIEIIQSPSTTRRHGVCR